MPDRLPICAGPGCSEPIPPRPPGKRGRPRRYHSDECKWRAAEERRQPTAWQVQGDLASVPPDPLTRRRRTLELVASLLDGAPAAPPEDQLAQCLTELPQLIFTLRRLSTVLVKPLAGRASQLAEDLDAAFHRSFREIA